MRSEMGSIFMYYCLIKPFTVKHTTVFLAIMSLIVLTACGERGEEQQDRLLKNITLIDGRGGAPEQTDILIQDGKIAAIGKDLKLKGNGIISDLYGMTIMPALISTHIHVGTLKGTTTVKENYTRENILRQLKQYEEYGVENVLAMGTDRPLLFETGLRDSIMHNLLPGARLFSAGYGFGVPGGAPPLDFAMDKVYRSASPVQVAAEMDSVAKLHPVVIKIWVDDFGGKFPKMDTAVYQTIIAEAHEHGLRVAAHLYYLEDAKRLVAAGVDIIAHSIRDKEVDDELLQAMKEKGVVYIPTLSLDEYSYIYARKADWINDPFFKVSLEPGVYDMITSKDYQDKLLNSPAFARNQAGFQMALHNLKRISDAGILISMGTDSGAMPLRAQGFSEHLELELMVQAGLTPLQAISIATKNAATVLKIDQQCGTLEVGKIADFIVLSADPVKDIKNTRTINAVFKAGKEVSAGPLKN